MRFKAGQRVIAINNGIDYGRHTRTIGYSVSKECHNYAKGWQGIVTSEGNNMINFDNGRIIKGCDGDSFEEVTMETKKFNIGDEVKVVKIRQGASEDKREFIGKTGIINVDDGTNHPFKINSITNDFWWESEELELVTEVTMTLKEAQKAAIDGAKVCVIPEIAGVEQYLFFDGKDFKYSHQGVISPVKEVFGFSRWKLYVEPEAPPRFTVNTLVYNTDGTIGKVMEDKGVYKGVRKYVVKFNAVRETLKNVDESELTEYCL